MTESRNIYLHETVDIVGQGAMGYMDQVATTTATNGSGGALDLVGTWYTMGSTGRWPQVINLWECVNGWTGWQELMERTNLQRTKSSELNDWWREALEVRSGGYDRLLASFSGSPNLTELRTNGPRASVFVHEVSRCRPGAANDYLAAVREFWAPLRSEFGHEVVGLYEVLLTDTEVMTIWATDPKSHCRMMAAEVDQSDLRISEWRVKAREYLTQWREELMTPYPKTVLSAGDSL